MPTPWRETTPHKRWRYRGQHMEGMIHLRRNGLIFKYIAACHVGQTEHSSLSAAQHWIEQQDRRTS